jgi:hypothetical protein
MTIDSSPSPDQLVVMEVEWWLVPLQVHFLSMLEEVIPLLLASFPKSW